MADNVQQLILNAVTASLQAAGIGEGAAVHLDHPDPLSLSDSLPAILVEAAPEGETLTDASVSGLEQRVFGVRVACLVAEVEGYAAEARSLGAAVERVLAAQTFRPAGKQGRCRLRASSITLTSKAEKPLAAYQQTWQITYFTRRGAPDTPY